MKQILTTVLFIIFVTSPTFADWKEGAKAIDISGGEDHTLVLTKNKWPWACGDNYWYQLGIGNNEDQKTLVRVHSGDMGTSYLQDINDVDAGWKHSLALERYDPWDPNCNGYVWAWGRNDEGQLGDNQENFYEPTPVQVLRGEQTPADPNNPDPNLTRIIAISAGRSGQHSLAIDANNSAYAWGYNKYGQCGNNESNNSKLTPVRVRRGEQPDDPNYPSNWLKHIIAISAGADQSMALEKDDPDDPNLNGCVYTWGTNRWGDDPCDVGIVSLGCGLLGTGSDVNFSDTPVKVLAGAQHPDDPNQHLKHIVAVAAGWDHCMALEKDDPYDPNIYDPAYTGRVFTWGNNGPGWGGGTAVGWERSVGGRLGNGTYNDSNVPVLVLAGEEYPNDPNQPYLNHIAAVSAGEGHSMALDADGYVYAWGDNQYGQLGNGRNEPCSAPVRVIAGMQNLEDPNSALSNIVAISAGHWHSLAIDRDGVVWVWGKTKDGRLGLANMSNAYPWYSSIPHRIPVVYNQTQEMFAFGIQAAVTGADDGDLLMASAGTYYENVEVSDVNITLESMDPSSWDVVGHTVIDAHYNNDPSYTVDFESGSDCTFAGFTLTNGRYEAVHCGGSSSVNITDCRIENNGGWAGIRINGSSANIANSRIQNNSSPIYSVYGIYCENGSTVSITDCNIAWNTAEGVYSQYSALAVTDSAIHDNGFYGIHAQYYCDLPIERSLIEGNGKSGVYAHDGCAFVLTGSVVRKNGWDGVDLEDNSSETLTNNWIHNNGTAHCSEGWGSGIWFEEQTCVAIVRNNTIYANWTYGIEANENSADPNIINCIISGNDSNDLYKENGDFETVNYCCLQNARAGGLGNKTGDPGFMNIATDANDLHLDESSQCKDAGDPNGSYSGESDIDGEERVINGRVDMGADEFYWSPADFNRDGIVNFLDYAMLAWHWHETDANGGYDDVFDLADNNAIGFGDILAFCDEWLWQAGWLAGPMPLMAGRGGAGMVEGLGLDAGLSAVATAERGPAIAEPVDIEAIMKWLAEIWLDPEVQKAIDEAAWWRLVESLKKEWDAGI